jgi:TonB family protein
MKLTSLLFLATSLLFANTLNASQDSPELQEAATLTQSVVSLLGNNKPDEALPLAKRALQIREKVLPPTDGRIATSLIYLANVYIAKQNYKAARDVVQRLVQAQEARFGPDDVNVASALDQFAVLQFRAGDDNGAEAAYKRALALREKGFGANSTEVAKTLYALGEFYRFKRDFNHGAENYRRALLIFGEKKGIDSLDYDRTNEGFTCLAYDHDKDEVLKELKDIRKRFDPMFAVPDPTDVLNGRALSLPKPEYPDQARAHHLSGKVVVKVWIDEVGQVTGARDMCQGLPYLSEASIAAALKARFTPTKLKGVPIKVPGVIVYNFRRPVGY